MYSLSIAAQPLNCTPTSVNVPKGLAPHEVDLYISAFKFCEKLIQEQNTDIGAAVTETTEKYSFIISDKELFAQFLFREITAYTEPSIGVVSPELDDKTWWSKLKKSEKFIPEYWQRYYDYLNRKPSWSLTAVQDIDSSTDEIMNALANPRSGRACDRMGMVFGYVQSGKTAHYIGLINKAVDAGYRIVVVLTGIHNSLRSQTQSRIDEEVLGYETSLENLADMIREPNVIGVGIGAHNRVKTIVQSITTRDEKGDVNKTTEGVSMVPPFIIVTKKNATVLRRILRFFRKNQCAEVIDGKKIITAKYPALIIDDEADQASINTNDSYDEKGRLNYDEPSGTVVNVRKSMWIHPTQDRAISVREAARLQTFPDSFVFCGSKDKQYQQVGNAVPPIMAKSIAEKLAQILEKNLAGRERNG